MKVEIDSNSGFCGGVIRAIDGAERLLDGNRKLYSLGAIVHNEAELSRLHKKGLITLNSLDAVRSCPAGSSASPHPTTGLAGGPPAIEPRVLRPCGAIFDGNNPLLLIRAHGEPPVTYKRAGEMGFEVADFTCPVVLKIQKSIRETAEMNAPDGQIVIFGKIGHAEVLGLVGQVDGKAVVVESLAQLEAALADGRIDASRHIDIFSQTTKSPTEYNQICDTLRQRMTDQALLVVHNTICRQVASRHSELSGFAKSHDVIVFVSGRESSNGRVLSDLCKSVNPRTWCVVDASELRPEWFRPDDNVGVCGATSTPKWLLEDVAERIKNLQ